MNPVLPQRNSTAGFTLVEMLVSVAVLVLIMTFIAQMMNSATISTTLSSRHVDTDAEARLVFDRMGADFARMSHRTDVDFDFSKQPDYQTLATASGTTGSTSGTSPQMFFYSEAPAYPAATSGTEESSVALIGYSINTTGSSYVPAYSIQRLSKGLTLNAAVNQTTGAASNESSSMLFLTSTAQGALPFEATGLVSSEKAAIGAYPDPPVDMSDYDLLSPEVLRMDFAFEVKDLRYPTTPSTVYSNFPIGFLPSTPQTGISNVLNIQAGDPNTTQPPYTINNRTPTVGDRFYDTVHNRAYACTNLLSSVTNGTVQTIPIWTPNGMADVKAIVVTIAILDQRTRKIVPPTSDYLGTIAGSLLTPSELGLNPKLQSSSSMSASSLPAPILTADLWQTEISDMLVNRTVPVTILGQVHVYQRFFYLNNN